MVCHYPGNHFMAGYVLMMTNIITVNNPEPALPKPEW